MRSTRSSRPAGVVAYEFTATDKVLDIALVGVDVGVGDTALLNALTLEIVPLVPVPETVLWSRLAEEGRLADDIAWDEGGFYSRWMTYAHLEHEELWAYEDLALRKAYETWGPTYLRAMDLFLRGYRKFKDHPDPFFRRKAGFHRKRCEELYPLLR